MNSSRRGFLGGLAVSSLVMAGSMRQAVASLLGTIGAPKPTVPPGLKIGFSAIAWNDKDTQSMEDLSKIGIHGIQLRANAVQDYPDPHALRDLLAQHHLTFVALSSGTAPLDPSLRQSTIETHIKNAKFARAAGGQYLQVVPGTIKSPGNIPTAEDCIYEAKLLTDIAKAVADVGMPMSVHNHMGTISQTPQGLDAIMDASERHSVRLELDVAHYLQGGGDPVAAIRKYNKRILFLHLKDVKDAATKNGYQFAELGQGRVDFPGVMAALADIHFQGWGIVELDGERLPPLRTPLESAELSKAYLQKLGVTLS